MHSSSCLYIGSPKSYSFISDPSEFLLTSIAFATSHLQSYLVKARSGLPRQIGRAGETAASQVASTDP